LGIGILRKIGGVYYLAGELQIGHDDSTAEYTQFQAKSQIVVFEDRPVNSGLYNITIVDDGSSANVTEFVLGDKSGTAGIQGCTIRVQDITQSAKFDIDGSGGSAANVDYFKLYATVFYGADAIIFPDDATNVEIIGCSFEACGQVDPGSAEVSGCFFINTSDVDAALLWNESIQISDCSFIGNTTGAGIEHPSANSAAEYDYDNLLFSGNTYDVLNSSGTAITVNKLPSSNPTSYEGTLVTFTASFTHTLTNIAEGSEVTYVENDSAQTVLHHVESVGSDGESVYTHPGGETVDILIFHLDYLPEVSNIIGLTLPNANVTLQIQQFDDPNYLNP
jgi:hypothetical protein